MKLSQDRVGGEDGLWPNVAWQSPAQRSSKWLPVLAIGCCLGLAAQNPVTDTFNPGADRTVITLAPQPDGQILAGGRFITIGGAPMPSMARMAADGKVDLSFTAAIQGGVDPAVLVLAVQPDGRTLVGGGFESAGGTYKHIVRLNANGSVDSSFAAGCGTDGYVLAMAIQADGRILVGGTFSLAECERHSGLARYMPDGTLDSSFSTYADDRVHCLAVQRDGKIVVGGWFTQLGWPLWTQARSAIGRLNPNGTLDTGFDPGATDSPFPQQRAAVHCVLVQPDEKILVGGSFRRLGGQPRECIGRLNPDGTVDAGFSATANGSVYTMALQSDGKILVGGLFTAIAGQARSRMARLNPDGTLDVAFDINSDSTVYSLTLQPDGDILVGGEFTSLGGVARSHLARLQRTEPATASFSRHDSTLTWERGGSSPELARVVFDASADGAVWTSLGEGTPVAGGWTLSGIVAPATDLIRARGQVVGGYQAGASYWVEAYTTVPPRIVGEPQDCTNNAATSVQFNVAVLGTEPMHYQWYMDDAALADGDQVTGASGALLRLHEVWGGDTGRYRVVVSNDFGMQTSRVARLDVLDPCILTHPVRTTAQVGQEAVFTVTAAGTALRYQWFRNGQPLPDAHSPALTLVTDAQSEGSDYTVFVSGSYGSVTSLPARLVLGQVAVDTTFSALPNGTVNAITVQPDGQILLGGLFSSVGGFSYSRLARLDGDGALDAAFNPSPNAEVRSIAVQPDGRILVGGLFTNLAGQVRIGLGRVQADGRIDAGFNPGANAAASVLLPTTDGRIWVGGWFTKLAGQSCNYLGRLSSDGTLDAGATLPNPNNAVLTLAETSDGRVVVGGWFTTIAGMDRRYLARLNADGSSDRSFTADSGAPVFCVALQADGRILVGGTFATLCGAARSNLGRLNADGTLDVTFNPGANGPVHGFAVQADGAILVAGAFTALASRACGRVGRLNPDGSFDEGFEAGANGAVLALAQQADGAILAGGEFTSLDGQGHSRIGRVRNNDAAVQTLSFEGSTATWMRGGAAPELRRMAFHHSLDGRAWMPLGEGERIPGGWRRTGLVLPASGTIRARGLTTGGWHNGSSGGVEMLLALGAAIAEPPGLAIATEAGAPILRITGTVGAVYQLEYAPVLKGVTGWSALLPFVLTNSPQRIPDSAFAGRPQRFYRVRPGR
jgi:uncharacterized delta-60 repeat protein